MPSAGDLSVGFLLPVIWPKSTSQRATMLFPAAALPRSESPFPPTPTLAILIRLFGVTPYFLPDDDVRDGEASGDKSAALQKAAGVWADWFRFFMLVLWVFPTIETLTSRLFLQKKSRALASHRHRAENDQPDSSYEKMQFSESRPPRAAFDI